jgi:hypothetical protein
MRVTKPLVLGIAAVLGLGLTTAVAADTHGALVQQGKALMGIARGRTGVAWAVKAAAAHNAHGAAVSTLARNRNVIAAHATGAMNRNHGGAVIAAAQKR